MDKYTYITLLLMLKLGLRVYESYHDKCRLILFRTVDIERSQHNVAIDLISLPKKTRLYFELCYCKRKRQDK